MTTNTKKTLFIVADIFAIITGVVLIFGIITIPFSVFLFMGGSKMREISNQSEVEFEKTLKNRTNLSWAIYILILTFPVGICALLPYIIDTVPQNNENKKSTSEVSDSVKDLDILFEKKEKGIISEEEYEKLKRKILDKIEK
ncbi:MAG: SHOCT domain-containing protein [Clostridia bacterium]|nr:SHOCT domain-containing protein [Clostridia bacterium]